MSDLCEWNGRIYPSQAAVAKAAGVNRATVSRHLDRWGSLDRLPVRDLVVVERRRSATRAMLMAGFGVEDIACRLDASLSTIRAFVRDMRRSGEISAMFPRKGDRK